MKGEASIHHENTCTTKSRCEQQQSKCGIVDSRAVPLADGRLLLYVLKSFYHDGYTRFGICISSLSHTSEVLEKAVSMI